MSSLIEVEVTVRVDGQVMNGFPFIRRILVNQADQFNYQKAADNNSTTYTTISGTNIPTARNVLIVKSDSQVNLRLNGAASGVSIPLNANGLVIIIDELDSTAPTINNPAASAAATIQGVAGGT